MALPLNEIEEFIASHRGLSSFSQFSLALGRKLQELNCSSAIMNFANQIINSCVSIHNRKVQEVKEVKAQK